MYQIAKSTPQTLLTLVFASIVTFSDLGLEGCIEHVWQDTIVYLDDDSDPILFGRAYGRVCRNLLHEELLRR